MCMYVCICFINKFIINNHNWHGLLQYYFFIIIQINWPFYRNHLGQIPLVLTVLYGNFSLIFKHTCSFSKHAVLFSRLLYRCFITLFSTRIFGYNFEVFCSCKFISCVLKAKYIPMNIEYIELRKELFIWACWWTWSRVQISSGASSDSQDEEPVQPSIRKVKKIHRCYQWCKFYSSNSTCR